MNNKSTIKTWLALGIILATFIGGTIIYRWFQAPPIKRITPLVFEGEETRESKTTDVAGESVVKEKNGMTEVFLPNPPEVFNKPSIDELKEFRKRSEELKAIFEKLKKQKNESELAIGIGGATVVVEPLYTYEDQTKGLLGRESLPQDSGILYVFQMDDAGRLFGTKGMKFPIDLVWLNNDSVVVHIQKNVPPDFDGALKSMWPARFVLEANAGFADRYGVRVGDAIDLSKIPH